MRMFLWVFFGGLALAVQSCPAALIDLGVFSFDVLIPAGTTPGINAFSITNLTGDPSLGGAALPPTFPIYTSINFLNSSVTLIRSSGATVVPLGALSAGANNPPALQFPETDEFLSATLSLDLSTTTFVTDTGAIYQATGPGLIVVLLPLSGGNLTAGLDSVLIQIDAEPVSMAPIPEPGTFTLLGVAIFCGAFLGHARPNKWKKETSNATTDSVVATSSIGHRR